MPLSTTSTGCFPPSENLQVRGGNRRGAAPRPLVAFLLGMVGLLSLAPAQSTAQPKPFVLSDGTTHWYLAVAVPGGVSWQEANAAAAAAGGYLATITSQQENAFVFSLVDDGAFWTRTSASAAWDGPWLGGWQAPLAGEPAGGWTWAELEDMSFTNWAAGQPDDNQAADRIHFQGTASARGGAWADDPGGLRLTGYVVEFSGATSPRTVGLKQRLPESFDGYTLIQSGTTRSTFLVDPRGRVVRNWNSAYTPGMSSYLLPNGNLLRTGNIRNTAFPEPGAGGILEEFDWDGNKVWSFPYSSAAFCQHHDIERLPNGNILMIVWQKYTRAEAIDAGRDPANLVGNEIWPDKIVEIKPTSTGASVVWEWNAWDHLVQDFDKSKANYGNVAAHPELIDINFTPNLSNSADWMHCNAVAYNAQLDQILISCRRLSEIWIIDHSTTTAEAAGHTGGRSGKGGDLLYRWGNPMAYRAGTVQDQTLFGQHDAQWIANGLPGAGNILVFNNGLLRAIPTFSSVDEIKPPTVDGNGNYPRTGAAWGPAAPTWTYQANPREAFDSGFVSGCQRLPNGNTLIGSGADGRSFEVTPADRIVWEYVNPLNPRGVIPQGTVPQGNMLFRSPRYAPDYPGFANKNLTPGGPLETYSTVLLADDSTAPHHVKIGTRVALTVQAPASPGRQFHLATSATAGALAVDHRFFRTAYDPLFLATLTDAMPSVFQGYFGRLDANGRAHASIQVPDIPALAGMQLYTAFLVIDPTARSGIAEMSNAVQIRIGR